MADVPRCLTVAELQALIDGSLPQARQAAAETHLESCDGCRRALEAQTGHASLIPPEVAGAASATRSMALEDAMRKLKSDTDDPAETLVSDTHAPSWLPTLSPSDDPRSLGRLGSYEILEVIGRGGMGTVFKARDRRLDRLVAVKVLNPDLAASGPARQRFLQEARSAAAVTHDHVVTIHAVDEAGERRFW
jgi:eukaryotic-like serine/threonine-protein kinase